MRGCEVRWSDHRPLSVVLSGRDTSSTDCCFGWTRVHCFWWFGTVFDHDETHGREPFEEPFRYLCFLQWDPDSTISFVSFSETKIQDILPTSTVLRLLPFVDTRPRHSCWQEQCSRHSFPFSCSTFPHLLMDPRNVSWERSKVSFLSQAVYHHYCGISGRPPSCCRQEQCSRHSFLSHALLPPSLMDPRNVSWERSKVSFLSQAVYHLYCGFPDAPFLLLTRAMLTSQFPFLMLYFPHLWWIPGMYHESDRKSHSVLSFKGRPPTLPWWFRTTFPAGPLIS